MKLQKLSEHLYLFENTCNGYARINRGVAVQNVNSRRFCRQVEALVSVVEDKNEEG